MNASIIVHTKERSLTLTMRIWLSVILLVVLRRSC